MTLPVIDNERARRIFLDRHLLSGAPTGESTGQDLSELIHQLGFVQVDSINTVARAHDLILFSRRQTYRQKNLRHPLERERQLFEHWTHDASIIPVDFFPYWRLRFERDHDWLSRKWSEWRRDGFVEKFDQVLQRIEANGPVCSAEVGEDEKKSSGGWWDWHPSKTALEFLWRTGALSVCKRVGFRKYYDLTERVMPTEALVPRPSTEETVAWACRAAMTRLGFATSGEIAAFWDLVTPAEAKAWCNGALARGEIVEVCVEQADGRLRNCYADPTIIDGDPPEPTSRVKVLSPFDPALRDRKRAQRLFGFHYRIEIFVPEHKRIYGYYVFPVLQGTKVIGRVDMKANRSSDRLEVRAFWPEAGVRIGKGRRFEIETEFQRVTKIAGVSDIEYAPDWHREPIMDGA